MGGKRSAIVIGTAVLLVGGFLIARPGKSDKRDGASGKTSPGLESDRPQSPPTVVVGKTPARQIPRIEAKLGGRVRFFVRSEVADEVHVHGYDIHGDIAADAKIAFDFKATIAGTFVVEFEHSGRQIARLTVVGS